MTFEQIALARRRLRLGIANVGFWVVTSSGGLWWLTSGAHVLETRACLIIGLAAIVVQAAFDVIGGAWLMPPPTPAPGEFLRRWSRGVLCHSLVLAGVGLLSLASLRLSSGFALAVLIATVGLALGRRQILRAMAGASISRIPRGARNDLAAAVSDPAFTGGIVGFGRRAVSLWPARWLQDLPHSELAVESWRREWQLANGLNDRAFVAVLGWNLLGTSLGTFAFSLPNRSPAEALFGHACWMTLWAFVGLLVLPSLSRSAVFAADRAAADSGLDARGWITRFAELVGEDGSAITAVQAIFYPVPSARMRMHQLAHASSRFVPGNLARTNLYYSWATLTLLGRAVHCNVGRPALWVFPPSA
jgi:hypothetical protein